MICGMLVMQRANRCPHKQNYRRINIVEELKPCKCGGKAVRQMCIVEKFYVAYRIKCERCGKKTKPCEFTAQAIDEWERKIRNDRET